MYMYEDASRSASGNDGFSYACLAGVCETDDRTYSEEEFMHSMEELGELVKACDMQPVGMVVQQLPHRTPGFYLGPGKVEEVRETVLNTGAQYVVFNDTLTPVQLKNLKKELDVTVLDRTSVILEIFYRRARSREARLQVELARLQYLKPRLIGMWETQNRQGGASGALSSKGEGEKQLELDRREIDHRITALKKELKLVEKERETQRKKRKGSGIPLVSLAGYTNAGKSTVMNSFVNLYSSYTYDEKKVFEADMLFATLDTTVRRISCGKNNEFLLLDTVGFIQKLPTSLIEAFKSTLEEVYNADLILHVVDRSDKHYKEHMEAASKVISELGAGDIPTILVYNKADRCGSEVEYPSYIKDGDSQTVYISAREENSVEFLCNVICENLNSDTEEAVFIIPYSEGSAYGYFMKNTGILDTEYLEEGIRLKVMCSRDFISYAASKFSLFPLP